MSRSYALIRFKKTGNIYYGCYNGTSDVLIPFICTPKECYDENIDCYLAISYCQNLSDQSSGWKFPDTVTDLDEVEIYTAYGGGFFWNGTGSESIKMIKDGIDTMEEDIVEIDGQPEWVKEFFDSIGVSEED